MANCQRRFCRRRVGGNYLPYTLIYFRLDVFPAAGRLAPRRLGDLRGCPFVPAVLAAVDFLEAPSRHIPTVLFGVMASVNQVFQVPLELDLIHGRKPAPSQV